MIDPLLYEAGIFITCHLWLRQQQQQNQKQQSSQTSTPKGALQSNEEYQSWKGGWRKVIKKTDAAVPVLG